MRSWSFERPGQDSTSRHRASRPLAGGRAARSWRDPDRDGRLIATIALTCPENRRLRIGAPVSSHLLEQGVIWRKKNQKWEESGMFKHGLRTALKTLTGLLGLGLGLGLGAAASAQTYPDKPIRIIMPLGPGGAGDVFLRVLGPELQKRLGQPLSLIHISSPRDRTRSRMPSSA